MKITKSKLKQIIKESLEDEHKEIIINLFKSGQPNQALELAKSFGAEDSIRSISLNGVNWRKADLKGSDLSGLDLTGVYATEADLSDADLSGVDLKGAYLRGADLRGANLKNAINLSQSYYPETTKYDKNTIWPKDFDIKSHKTIISGDNITVWLKTDHQRDCTRRI